MEKEIEEIIAKHLPAQVGDVLKKTLEKAALDAREVAIQKETILSNRTTIADLEKRLSAYISLDNYQAALDAREKSISERERNQKVFEAELKLAEAEKRNNDMVGFVGMVFRSPIYRKTVSENDYHQSNWDSAGNCYRNEKTGSMKTVEKSIE